MDSAAESQSSATTQSLTDSGVATAAEPVAPAAVPSGPSAFLDVRDLHVQFPTEDGLVKAVDGLSFTLERGRTLGIVGESGSGKSVTSLALLGLHKRNKHAKLSGEIWVGGDELISASEEDVRALRGNRMAMIFQDPLTAMHPYFTVGDQIAEAYRVHNKASKKGARTRAIEMLDRVGIPNPSSRFDDYPHQFSGGMRQRAMIAMALSCNPQLLIADEPTTALDVTVQAQILDLMRDLQRDFNTAIILITHDLGVVAEFSDDLLVMYAGRVVEYGSAADLFYRPQMPYTWGLLQSVTRLDRAQVERLRPIAGSPPSLIHVPKGCPFHPRCPYVELAQPACQNERPELLEVSPGHTAACHLSVDERSRVFTEKVAPTL
jgi:peptide/nickel transport system ATP-binding protein